MGLSCGRVSFWLRTFIRLHSRCESLRLVRGQIVAGEVDDHVGAVGLPVSQQRETELLIHEPADFQILFRAGRAGAFRIEAVVERGVVGRVPAPLQAEFAFGEDSGCPAIGRERPAATRRGPGRARSIPPRCR